MSKTKVFPIDAREIEQSTLIQNASSVFTPEQHAAILKLISKDTQTMDCVLLHQIWQFHWTIYDLDSCDVELFIRGHEKEIWQCVCPLICFNIVDASPEPCIATIWNATTNSRIGKFWR